MIKQDIFMLISIFCDADDFCKQFESEWRKILMEDHSTKAGKRKTELSFSKAMTIVIMFHKTGYRTFKDYYNRFVLSLLKQYFPKFLSYKRFVNLMKT